MRTVPVSSIALRHERLLRRFINLASATPKDLDLLTAACNPATFGCGKKEVYDESYRKAVKMDPADFAITLDPAGFGLTRTIEDQLLQGETEKMRIKAQLHQLNVYGDPRPLHPSSATALTF